MTLRARASRVAVAALLLGMGFGLGGLGPPAPGAGQPADECCYQVPSGSMKPTLFPHDRIGLAKYPQGTLPRTGDVIAFKLAKPGSPIYVKRAIGFAGDKVQLSRGVLDINGKSVKRERLADFVDEDEGGKHFRRWREILPNGVSYETIDLTDDASLSNTAVIAVPPGQIFVLGDNRENSLDSRTPSAFGNVSSDLVMGRVVVQ